MAPSTAINTCYFDGHCGMCRRSARILARLDLFGRLRLVDQSQLDPRRLPVDPDAAIRGMPMLTSDGRALVGFPAVRRALMQTPLALFAWPLYLFGVDHLSGWVYNQIAARRARACVLNPQADPEHL